MKRILMILIFGLILIGCGESDSSLNEDQNIELQNLPTIATKNKSEKLIYQKTLLEEIETIKNSVHTLPWAYYLKDGRWGISTSSAPYVFSLMPIVNGIAGWGEVSLTAGQININNNTISIGDIPPKTTCDYYDWGLQETKEDCIIQADVENFKNSTIDIAWWFFETVDGWYIMQEGSSIAYKFAGDENGQYDWTHTVDIGINPTLFVENGVKKMKFDTGLTGEKLIGIDVSKHNDTINWEAVDVSFAFIKATEGYPETSYELSHQIEMSFLDSKFEENMNAALAEGLLVAPYHFIRVDYNEKISDAKEEAKHFISKIRPYYDNYKLLPPVIDIENPPTVKENPNNRNQIGRWSKIELTNWIKAFANEVESELGVKPILYMNESFSNSEVESSLFDSYQLWIAKYMFSNKNGTVVNSLAALYGYDTSFKPNREYLFWQFTETAVDIDGINNFVDKNVFEGSLSDLEALLVQTPQTDAILTRMSPSGTPVLKTDRTLVLYGENLKSVANVFIAGVDIASFSVHEERYILIETTQRHGGNLEFGVPFGYRDVIVKFENGSRVILKNYFKIIEDAVVYGNYPETVLQNKSVDSVYARKLNAFWETSFGQDLLGQCTWYVYGRFIELINQKFFTLDVHDKIKNAFWNHSGRDAKNWSSLLDMSGQGISTNSLALPFAKREKGLLAVWECGTHGHVGFVEEVGGDNKEWYILSDFNRANNLNYKKQKYKFDSSQNIDGALDDRVGGCYPTFYNLMVEGW